MIDMVTWAMDLPICCRIEVGLELLWYNLFMLWRVGEVSWKPVTIRPSWFWYSIQEDGSGSAIIRGRWYVLGMWYVFFAKT